MQTKWTVASVPGAPLRARLIRGFRCLWRWWLIGLRGLGSLAATEAGMAPQWRVRLFPRPAGNAERLDMHALGAVLGLEDEGEMRALGQRLQGRFAQGGKALFWTGERLEAEVLAIQVQALGWKVEVAPQSSRWE